MIDNKLTNINKADLQNYKDEYMNYTSYNEKPFPFEEWAEKAFKEDKVKFNRQKNFFNILEGDDFFDFALFFQSEESESLTKEELLDINRELIYVIHNRASWHTKDFIQTELSETLKEIWNFYE